MTSKITTLGMALALASAACDARTLIGMTPDASAPDDAGPTTPGVAAGTQGHLCAPPDVIPSPSTLPASLAGTWTGHFDGPGFPLQSENVLKLSIQQPRPDGSQEISFVLGSLPPPAPATNAHDGYPPSPYSGYPGYVEGFSYPIRAIFPEGAGFLLPFYTNDPWQSWCALQTSYFLPDLDQYNCLPSTDAAQACSQKDKTACPQALLCDGLGPCQCDACGCAASSSLVDYLDLTFAGDVATGRIAFVGDSTVQFTRDPN